MGGAHDDREDPRELSVGVTPKVIGAVFGIV
jgi:hypothetical protein